MIWTIAKHGLEREDMTIFGIVITISTLALYIIVRATIESIRLYQNIRHPESVSDDKFTYKKPNFAQMILVLSIPFIGMGYILYRFSARVENIDIPKTYLKIEGFDLENPKYTDPLLCQKFVSEVEKYKDASILDIDKNHPAYS